MAEAGLVLQSPERLSGPAPGGGAPRPRRAPEAMVAELLSELHAGQPAEAVLADAIRHRFPGRIALVSSFGADSAVLLGMVAKIDRSLPVLMLETGMLFPETLGYLADLTARLGLTDLRLIRPDGAETAVEDGRGTLHSTDPDRCCALRKTRPLERALAPFDAWITGRKRHQAATRADLPLFEAEDGTGRIKLNPLADWTAAQLRDWREAAGLPAHPLVAQGYPSIGCAPCTTPVGPGEDSRAGRWRGQGKVECGIHFDGERWVRGPAA